MQHFDPFQPRMSEAEFDAFLRLCHEQYLEMLASGAWPWKDVSPDVVDLDNI